MKQYFYLDEKRQRVGPISEQELKSRKIAGLILNKTYLWTEGMTNWLPFDKIFPEAVVSSPPSALPPLPPLPEAMMEPAKSPLILKNKKALLGISLALACVAIIGILLSSFMGDGMSKEEAYEELRKCGIVNSVSEMEGEVGQRALCKAAEQGNLKIVQLLISGGVPVNAEVDGRAPALYQAIRNNHKEVVKFLLDVPGVDANMGSIFRHIVRNNNVEMGKILLDASCLDVNQPSANNWTALIHATKNGCTELVRLLLDVPGIDVNKVARHNRTALFYAAMEGNVDVLCLLLKAGAEVNMVDKFGETPLEHAARKGHTEIVKILQAAGARK